MAVTTKEVIMEGKWPGWPGGGPVFVLNLEVRGGIWQAKEDDKKHGRQRDESCEQAYLVWGRARNSVNKNDSGVTGLGESVDGDIVSWNQTRQERAMSLSRAFQVSGSCSTWQIEFENKNRIKTWIWTSPMNKIVKAKEVDKLRCCKGITEAKAEKCVGEENGSQGGGRHLGRQT